MKSSKILIFCVVALTACEETGLTPAQYHDIPQAEISSLQNQALHNDGESALLLANYYYWSKSDYANSLMWLQVGAEDGNVQAMHNLGVQLSFFTNDSEKQAKARYWLTKAKENGSPYSGTLDQLDAQTKKSK